MRLPSLGLALTLALAACAPPSVSEQPVDGNNPGPLPGPDARGLAIVHVDVGQGDSTLIIGPERVLLVDGGDEGKGDEVLDSLREYRINVLDWVVATHPHADHIGGLDEVLARVDALEGVWDNYDYSGTVAFSNYAAAANATTGGRNTIAPGHVFDLGEGAKATCYAVSGRLINGVQVTNVDDTNDKSVVLVVEWGEFRYVIAGDLGGYDTQYVRDVETQLAPLIGDVDVIRVSHHGSRYSTNVSWLNTLQPEAAVVSAGNGNDYGHPSSDVLSRLTAEDPGVTIPPVDLWLTEKGYAPSPYIGSGDVTIFALPSVYRIGDQLYDAAAR